MRSVCDHFGGYISVAVKLCYLENPLGFHCTHSSKMHNHGSQKSFVMELLLLMQQFPTLSQVTWLHSNFLPGFLCHDPHPPRSSSTDIFSFPQAALFNAGYDPTGIEHSSTEECIVSLIALMIQMQYFIHYIVSFLILILRMSSSRVGHKFYLFYTLGLTHRAHPINIY